MEEGNGERGEGIASLGREEEDGNGGGRERRRRRGKRSIEKLGVAWGTKLLQSVTRVHCSVYM